MRGLTCVGLRPSCVVPGPRRRRCLVPSPVRGYTPVQLLLYLCTPLTSGRVIPRCGALRFTFYVLEGVRVLQRLFLAEDFDWRTSIRIQGEATPQAALCRLVEVWFSNVVQVALLGDAATITAVCHVRCVVREHRTAPHRTAGAHVHR